MQVLSDSAIHAIRQNYMEYCSRFDSIVHLSYKRGYRYMGVEGEMLSYIYTLEKHYPELPGLSRIRACEREYLNRNDESSIIEIKRLTRVLADRINRGARYSDQQKAEIAQLLSNYTDSFEGLIALDKSLGLRTNTGIRRALSESGNLMEEKILSAIDRASIEEKQQLAMVNLIFALLSILLCGATIGLSIYFSRYLVNYLEKLTSYISQLAKHDFNYSDDQLNLRRSSKEIRKIYIEFRNMVAQLRIREKQRDAAIAEVQMKEKRYRDLAELLPQSIFETDRLGNLVYVNKAWYKAFGYLEEDMEEGLNLIEILQTNTENKLFGLDKLENSEYIAIRKGGGRFPAQVYIDNIVGEDRISGRRGIIIDATLRNRYVESLQKETARAVSSAKKKSSFLANMSHEIRTPMNSIIGFANLLSTAEIPEDQKDEFVQHIQSSGKLLLNLIDDIIDIAKIEAGEIKIKEGSCQPAKIIHELLSTFDGYKSNIGKSDIQLKTHIPDEEINCTTDGFRLKQILSNLISNAVKFTNEGEVIISCEVKNGRTIIFAVEDTGVGMTKEELNVIFSRFQRTNSSEEKNIAGTGLGLTISKNLVELLGGQMWVSSVPGEGSRFSFELPFTPVPQKNGPGSISSGNDKLQYDWSGKTILVAEDDETSYVFLKEILQKTRARIVHVINGKEVVEAVKFTDSIDIILMDIHMPFLDGYQATQTIKKLRPSLPVIAQTAYAMDGDREKSIMAGCDDHLTKPIHPPSLLAKISQFIQPGTDSPPEPSQAKENTSAAKKKQK